jgi:hypothetical protein
MLVAIVSVRLILSALWVTICFSIDVIGVLQKGPLMELPSSSCSAQVLGVFLPPRGLPSSLTPSNKLSHTDILSSERSLRSSNLQLSPQPPPCRSKTLCCGLLLASVLFPLNNNQQNCIACLKYSDVWRSNGSKNADETCAEFNFPLFPDDSF